MSLSKPTKTLGEKILSAATGKSGLGNKIFAAETVAHLRGYEREILPLSDAARTMHAALEKIASIKSSTGGDAALVREFKSIASFALSQCDGN